MAATRKHTHTHRERGAHAQAALATALNRLPSYLLCCTYQFLASAAHTHTHAGTPNGFRFRYRSWYVACVCVCHMCRWHLLATRYPWKQLLPTQLTCRCSCCCCASRAAASCGGIENAMRTCVCAAACETCNNSTHTLIRKGRQLLVGVLVDQLLDLSL